MVFALYRFIRFESYEAFSGNNFVSFILTLDVTKKGDKPRCRSNTNPKIQHVGDSSHEPCNHSFMKTRAKARKLGTQYISRVIPDFGWSSSIDAYICISTKFSKRSVNTTITYQTNGRS